MDNALVLAIDQGTTNTKALLVDRSGAVIASASRPMTVDYPQPGWAEQSAEAIWAAVRAVVDELATHSRSGDVVAVAVSNQRESIVVWDAATGKPLAPCIIWQCRRTASACEALIAAGHGDFVEARTGLGVNPLFPASKIGWILDRIPDGRARAATGAIRAGTIDSWLLWNFTGGAVHATDHSNASRTQLFDTETLAWSDELCELFGVPKAMLADVKSSDSRFSETSAHATNLPAGIPVHGMMGDSHAALFGHGVREPGTVKATYGTGTSLMSLVPKRVRSRHGLSGTIAWSLGGRVWHALEGNISVSGQTAAFMSSLLGLKDAGALADLAMTVPSSNGVTFIPALVGLGAPYWRNDVRGEIYGLALGTKPAHLARAAIEAVAFQVADVFTAMEADIGAPLSGLSVDGGASRNDFLMQFQADILDRPLRRGKFPEVSALGAASVAFHGLGLAMMGNDEGQMLFTPAMPEDVREAHLAGWRKAVGHLLA
ncbi:FGGY family carbohydrate kinase [Pleomorphomonas sp. NRK KF1]|uniref:FGGY family carbohydrate kinase n=1 Tax=Pleomorphomonas sp. NRK KF1 TaxID=2943000 RepID=UPI002043FB93|nr:FGGY-family carbohydrate kinase [Pleomorphomonas sp. NRK KF1]MCM5553499.1 FGGY-family carbohydrate kinase [Pleomorphomonas sp. NRK KF1]